jgi:hypothetical protein
MESASGILNPVMSGTLNAWPCLVKILRNSSAIMEINTMMEMAINRCFRKSLLIKNFRKFMFLPINNW